MLPGLSLGSSVESTASSSRLLRSEGSGTVRSEEAKKRTGKEPRDDEG